MKRQKHLINQFILILTLILPLSQSLMAQDEEVRLREFNLDDNVAVDGYDVVSYYMGEPEKGSKSLSYTYKGVTYWFSNEDNLALFKKQPEKFEPAYGGWCAYAMGVNGKKEKVDPKTFKIIDGKLYLFYNYYFNNTLIEWNKNEKELKEKADRYWQQIIE